MHSRAACRVFESALVCPQDSRAGLDAICPLQHFPKPCGSPCGSDEFEKDSRRWGKILIFVFIHCPLRDNQERLFRNDLFDDASMHIYMWVMSFATSANRSFFEQIITSHRDLQVVGGILSSPEVVHVSAR